MIKNDGFSRRGLAVLVALLVVPALAGDEKKT